MGKRVNKLRIENTQKVTDVVQRMMSILKLYSLYSCSHCKSVTNKIPGVTRKKSVQ